MPLLPEEEYPISDLARYVAANFDGLSVSFDSTKADGQHRKNVSNAMLRQRLANFTFTSLEEGIRLTVADYKANRQLYRH